MLRYTLLLVKASRSCEMLDCTCPTTQRYIPEELNLQHYRFENLKKLQN